MAEENEIFENLSEKDILKYYEDILEIPENEYLVDACGGAQASGCSSCVYSCTWTCK